MVIPGNLKRHDMSEDKLYLLLENETKATYSYPYDFFLKSKIKIFQLSLGGKKDRSAKVDAKKVFGIMKMVRYDFSVLVELTLCYSKLDAFADSKIFCLIRQAPFLKEFRLEDCYPSEILLVRTMKFLKAGYRSFNFIILCDCMYNADQSIQQKRVYFLSKIAENCLNMFHIQISSHLLEIGKIYFYTAVDMIGRSNKKNKVYVGSQAGWRLTITNYCNSIGILLFINPWNKEHIQ